MGFVSTWMRSEADEWGVSARMAWAIAVGPIVLAGLIALSALYRPLYRVLLNEDALVEWLQFAFLVGLVIVSVGLAWRLRRMGRTAWAITFALAALTAFFIAGEEISWGQRILGFATPADLEAINEQGETTIHNIGPILSFLNLGIFIVTITAGLAPFIWRWGRLGRPRDLDAMILVPPLFLASSFLFAGGWRLIRYALLEEGGYVISRYNEVGELLLYGALFAYAYLLYRRLPEVIAQTTD